MTVEEFIFKSIRKVVKLPEHLWSHKDNKGQGTQFYGYPQFRNPTNSLRSLRSKPPRMRFLLFKLAFCHILTDMSA